MFFATLSARESGLSSTKMQVRVEVDDHIDGREELLIRVKGVVEGSLDRFQDRITRVDVHLSQRERSPKGQGDLCCRMEAYAGPLTPIVVSHEAITLTEAIHAAAAKLHRAVLAVVGRKTGVEAAAGDSQEAGTEPTEGLGHLRSS
jgi:hypothetical protein